MRKNYLFVLFVFLILTIVLISGCVYEEGSRKENEEDQPPEPPSLEEGMDKIEAAINQALES